MRKYKSNAPQLKQSQTDPKTLIHLHSVDNDLNIYLDWQSEKYLLYKTMKLTLKS
jgi:hypothetical protein